MAKYVLDTMTVTALMKGHSQAIERLVAAGRTGVLIPTLVVAEIAYGLARLPKGQIKRRLEERFRLILGEVQRAEWTDEVSYWYGAVKAAFERQGTLLADHEAILAAHALGHQAVLATSDLQHLSQVPELDIEDWLSGDES